MLMLSVALPTVAQEPEYDDIIKPTFKGSDLNRFREWVANRISLSPDEYIDGTLIISFVVGLEGKVEDITLIEGVHPDMDERVMKILKYSPKWKPGIKDGKPVRVKYTLPLVFRNPRPQSPPNIQTTGYEQQVGRRPYPTSGHSNAGMRNPHLNTSRGHFGQH